MGRSTLTSIYKRVLFVYTNRKEPIVKETDSELLIFMDLKPQDFVFILFIFL